MRTRDKAITIRMTEQEQNLFINRFNTCEDVYKNKTDFIIALLTQKRIIVIEDIKVALIELKRQGNNLNQLTRFYNQGGKSAISIDQTLSDCRKAYYELFQIYANLKIKLKEQNNKKGDKCANS